MSAISPDGGVRRRRAKLPLSLKLLLAFGLPTTALFAVFAVVSHEVAKNELDAELGKRLVAIASATAKQIQNPSYLAGLDEGDEDNLGYQRVRRTLAQMAEATDVSRLYLFDENFESLGDSAADVPIRLKYHQAELDRRELTSMFQSGEATASVLFEGKDGRLYKAAYAAVLDEDGKPVLAVGVDAPARYFERVTGLRRSLLLYGALLVFVVMVIAVGVAMLITRPVRALADAAERIGHGEMADAIEVRSNDEIGFLARTMEQMRSDLRDRDERAQMMLAGIAHEVRNPLGGMELFAGILRDELPEDDERRGHVDRISRELKYLKRVVEQFLEYARRPAPELGPVAVGSLCREVADSASAEADKKQCELRSEVPEGLAVLADDGLLRRALLNLVHNAIQATESAQEPWVQLSATARGDGTVAIAVENRGQPIPDDVVARMFEPFYTSREKGTGLGLAFVRDIANEHGGRVEFESASGTTRFTLILPEASGEAS